MCKYVPMLFYFSIVDIIYVGLDADREIGRDRRLADKYGSDATCRSCIS